jgi:hypothetical protein
MTDEHALRCRCGAGPDPVLGTPAQRLAYWRAHPDAVYNFASCGDDAYAVRALVAELAARVGPRGAGRTNVGAVACPKRIGDELGCDV